MAESGDPVDRLLELMANDIPSEEVVSALDKLLIDIATDPALARKLTAKVATGPAGRNNSELADAVKDLLGRLAVRIDQATELADSTVDTIDKYAVPLSLVVVTAGFGGVLLGTFAAAPFVLGIGVFGFVSGAAGRYWVKKAAIDDRTNAKLVRHLQGMLK